jgi:hypothetical protein
MPIIALDQLQQFAAVNLRLDPGAIPGPKIIPNACMVRINWVMANGKVAHNVLYATYTGTPVLTTAVANSVVAPIFSAFTSSGLAALMRPETNLNGVSLLDVRSNTGLFVHSTTTAVPGTAATGFSLPDEVAAVVTLLTANRGKSGRGRFYVPNFANAALAAGGVMSAGSVTALQNFATNGVQAGVTVLGAPVLGLPARAAYTSPVTGREFPARPAQTLPITSFVVQSNHWDSQRRRGLK